MKNDFIGDTDVTHNEFNVTCWTQFRELYKRNAFGQTHLMSALSSKDFKLAKLLIEAGANVNLCDPFGNTTLLYAVRARSAGSADMTRILIDAGVNIDTIPTHFAITGLMYASMNGYTDIVKILLDASADTKKRVRGNDSLVMAQGYKQHDVVRLIENHRLSTDLELREIFMVTEKVLPLEIIGICGDYITIGPERRVVLAKLEK